MGRNLLNTGPIRTFISDWWPVLVATPIAAAGLWLAVSESDAQGRRDLQYAFSVRMTCEEDPESGLWSGECERIEGAIARTDRPSFLDLYQAFRIVHHEGAPASAAAAGSSTAGNATPLDIDSLLAGSRYIIQLKEFLSARTLEDVHAIKAKIDRRDRALLLIERDGRLSTRALVAGTLANLTSAWALSVSAGLALLLGYGVWRKPSLRLGRRGSSGSGAASRKESP
jgi:hypothetical protein